MPGGIKLFARGYAVDIGFGIGTQCVKLKARVLLTSKPLFSKCCRLWGWEVLKNAVLALRPRLNYTRPWGEAESLRFQTVFLDAF